MTDPGGRGDRILAVFIFFLVLCTIACALRVLTRIKIQKAFGWDDRLAVLAWMSFVAFSALAITGIYYGAGRHIADIQPQSNVLIALKYWWFCPVLLVISNIIIKASIGVMLLRLSVQKVHRALIWVSLTVLQLYNVFFLFLFLLQCHPVDYFWNRVAGGEGSCINPRIISVAYYGYSAISCVTDWIFATLPAFFVWQLQIGGREKASVILILATGAVASTATIARIPYISRRENTDDFLYSTIELAVWSDCELGLALTAVCCATLRPLFRTIFPPSACTSGDLGADGASQRAFLPPTVSTPEQARQRSYRASCPGFEHVEMGEVRHAPDFGTITMVWHPKTPRLNEANDDSGSSHSSANVINHKVSFYRTEDVAEDATNELSQQQDRPRSDV